MTTDHRQLLTQRAFQDSKRADGQNHVQSARSRGEVLGAHAGQFLAGLPAQLEDQMTRHPYRTVGIALAVGLGTGIVVGSRLWRAALVSAASVAVVEFGRGYVHQEAKQQAATHAGKPMNVTWS